MSTTQTNPTTEQEIKESEKARVTMTVFDLTLFDDVKLEKYVQLPTKPTTLEEAMAAVGNDLEKLLDVVHEGLIAETKETAKSNMDGFLVVSEDETAAVPYTGKFADESKSKLINNAVLSMAKMLGFEKSLPKEKKAALKEQAKDFLRANPTMIAGIQGVAPVAATEPSIAPAV